jgi:predicted metal-binding protein
VAIITCGNVKNELGCPAIGCLAFLNAGKGAFSRYDEGCELVGFTTCAGCPTEIAPDKILTKIKPLVELSQAEVIHMSTCMEKICPFVNKYKSVIANKYPDIELVMSTDQMSDESLIKLAVALRKMLTEDQPDITEEYLKAVSFEELRRSLSTEDG